jgi:hypothetical protein
VFELDWPIGQLVTRGGDFVREFRLVLFGHEWHWVAIDNIRRGDSIRLWSRGWAR